MRRRRLAAFDPHTLLELRHVEPAGPMPALRFEDAEALAAYPNPQDGELALAGRVVYRFEGFPWRRAGASELQGEASVAHAVLPPVA